MKFKVKFKTYLSIMVEAETVNEAISKAIHILEFHSGKIVKESDLESIESC